MNRKAILLCCLIAYGKVSYGQCPTVNFIMPGTVCINEQIYPQNTSGGATTYSWDFCSGDFELTPSTESIGSSSSLNRGRSFRITNTSGGDWVGFSIDQASNRLVRFEFGNSPQNTPTITNLGNPDGILAGAYDFDIILESGEWHMMVINSTTSDLVRISFGTDLMNSTPTTTNLGSMGELNTPNNLTVVNELGNIFIFISNGASGSITRLEFGGSILNNPNVNSFDVTGINNPRGIDIVKDCDRWVGLVTSYSSNKVFYLDFNNGLSQIPASGEITFYTSYSFPAALSIIYEGGQYYSMIQSALGDLYKLSFGASIADFTGTGQNLGDFGLNSNFATEWINTRTDWYGFSIELSNPTTPGAGNLIRYTFPTNCEASPSVSSIESPSVEYFTSGNHQVTLIAKNSNNDINAVNHSITISPSLAPQLSAQIAGNCLSSPISFTGQQLSGNISSWNWDFGDGVGTSTLQNDTYTYATAGAYQIKLSVTDANGCNNLYIDSVTVYEEPLPAFTIPGGTLCMNNSMAFTNVTIGETGPAVTWSWDFNGEGSSSDKDPSFTFLTPGNKTVTLTSSIPGCANVAQQTFFIEEAPITNFSANPVCNGQSTLFADSTTGTNLTTWNWDFGDGNISTDTAPIHTYALPGKYAVTLTVSNSLGCSTSKTDTIYNHALPVVNFTNDLPCSSSPIQFTDQSIVQDAGLVAWEWDFGDGNTDIARNPQHIYGQIGDFTVQLKVYSQYGCVDSAESVISVIQGPEVAFGWDNGCVGEATTFTDETFAGGQPLSWFWQIENQIYNSPTPQHTFNTPGTYTIALSVTSANLCAQTLFSDIIIEDMPVTSFGYLESCDDNTVTFFDTTPSSIDTRVWKINGTPNETDSIMTDNLDPGNYIVSLTATTTQGCTEESTKDIQIIGPPEASFTASTFYGASPLHVQFINESTGANSYIWNFGDNNNSTSDEDNPTFIFTETGVGYTVTLIASSGNKCTDTTTQVIEVVEAIHGVSINAVIATVDGTIALSMSNTEGTYTYTENNSRLIFTLDNGAEQVKAFNNTLYPGKSIYNLTDFTLGDLGNSKILCVALEFIDANPPVILDKNCLSLSNQEVIIEAYPNPTVDQINLSVVLPESGNVRITLIDRTGAVIMTDNYEAAQEGLNSYTIDATTYRSGLYLVKIETDNEEKVMKVVIDK